MSIPRHHAEWVSLKEKGAELFIVLRLLRRKGVRTILSTSFVGFSSLAGREVVWSGRGSDVLPIVLPNPRRHTAGRLRCCGGSRLAPTRRASGGRTTTNAAGALPAARPRLRRPPRGRATRPACRRRGRENCSTGRRHPAAHSHARLEYEHFITTRRLAGAGIAQHGTGRSAG